MVRKDLNAHLFGPGPKRILALDGGGIRGILTLQLLRWIEKNGGKFVTEVLPVKPSSLTSHSFIVNGGLNLL